MTAGARERTSRLLGAAALLLATACTATDDPGGPGADRAPAPQVRAARAAAITDEVAVLPGVAEVSDDYRFAVAGEPDRFTVTVELVAGVGDAGACAPVATYDKFRWLYDTR